MKVYELEKEYADGSECSEFEGIFSTLGIAQREANTISRKEFDIRDKEGNILVGVSDLKFEKTEYGYWIAKSKYDIYNYIIFEHEVDKYVTV